MQVALLVVQLEHDVLRVEIVQRRVEIDLERGLAVARRGLRLGEPLETARGEPHVLRDHVVRARAARQPPAPVGPEVEHAAGLLDEPVEDPLLLVAPQVRAADLGSLGARHRSPPLRAKTANAASAARAAHQSGRGPLARTSFAHLPDAQRMGRARPAGVLATPAVPRRAKLARRPGALSGFTGPPWMRSLRGCGERAGAGARRAGRAVPSRAARARRASAVRARSPRAGASPPRARPAAPSRASPPRPPRARRKNQRSQAARRRPRSRAAMKAFTSSCARSVSGPGCATHMWPHSGKISS